MFHFSPTPQFVTTNNPLPARVARREHPHLLNHHLVVEASAGTFMSYTPDVRRQVWLVICASFIQNEKHTHNRYIISRTQTDRDPEEVLQELLRDTQVSVAKVVAALAKQKFQYSKDDASDHLKNEADMLFALTLASTQRKFADLSGVRYDLPFPVSVETIGAMGGT